MSTPAEFCERLTAGRPEAEWHRVATPREDPRIELYRCSWNHTGFHAWGGTRTERVVRWCCWADGEYVGGDTLKRTALEHARWLLERDAS